MTDNSKQIYDLIVTSKRLTPTFAQALHKHPNAKRFTVVATKTERTFTFVPSHLDRLVADSAKIASIDRPETLTKKAIAQQIYRTCGVLFNQMRPSLMFKYKIDDLLAKQLRFGFFNLVGTFIDKSAALDKDLHERANLLYIKYVDTFTDKTQTLLDKANTKLLAVDDKTIAGISYTASQDGTDVFVSINNGMELTDPEDIWEWLGTTPDQLDSLDADALNIYFKRLGQLRRYTAHIVRIMLRANTITHKNFVDDIRELELIISEFEKIQEHRDRKQ